MKLTVYELNPGEAQAADQTVVGFWSTWALTGITKATRNTIVITRMLQSELLFFISVSFKRLRAIMPYVLCPLILFSSLRRLSTVHFHITFLLTNMILFSTKGKILL